MQVEIIIGEVKIPIIKEEEVLYYPISYLGSKVLLKDLSPSQLKQNGYGDYIKEFGINYGEYSIGESQGGVQKTNCISQDGLKEILKNSKVGRLSIDQRKAMKKFCDYLYLNIDIDFNKKFKESITEEELNEHDYWSKECINSLLEEMPNILWQKCNRCGKYYPYHENFWVKEVNKRNKQPLRSICNNCEGVHIKYLNNNEYTKSYYDGDRLLYNIYKSDKNDIYEIYNKYLNGEFNYPSILRNSLNVTNIILKLYKDKILEDINNYNKDYISKLTKIPKEYISIKSLDRILMENIEGNKIFKIGKKPYNKKEKITTENKMTFEDAKFLLNTYLENNNIIINDVYNHDYNSLFVDAKIEDFVKNIHKNKFDFIMKYFDNKYPAYKFKSILGQKYWNNRDNADQAMKYFIEHDLKIIPIEKIPLYVTKINLIMKAKILHKILVSKRFDHNLFEWIDRLYPNIFVEEDFDIGITRNEFDSMEEKMIHDILKKRFNNVFYNNRNSDNKINIMGMFPDWFIFTDKNVYIIEYFGIEKEQKKENKRITNYLNRTNKKLGKYDLLPYAEKVFLYPSDLKNKFKGLKEKLKLIS